jgi:hypothetical protein
MSNIRRCHPTSLEAQQVETGGMRSGLRATALPPATSVKAKALLFLVLPLLAFGLAVGPNPQSASAAVGFANSSIADVALRYVGQWGATRAPKRASRRRDSASSS